MSRRELQNFEVMDRNFEDDQWNIFDGFAIPSSNSSHFGLHSGNVQDSAGSAAGPNNQAQATGSYENPVVGYNQDQNMAPVLSGCNPFVQSLKENLHMLNQGLGIPNDYTTSNDQLLESNMIGNNTLINDMNHQYSSFQIALFPQDPVEAGAGINLQNGQMITPPGAWNIRAPQNQFSVVNASASGYPPNYVQHDSSASNRHASYPNHHAHSQFETTTYNSFGGGSSVPPRPTRAMGITIQQGDPISVNTATRQRDKAIILESSSFGAQAAEASFNMVNQQYAIPNPEVTSSGPTTTTTTSLVRNQSLNLQTGRLQRDSPITERAYTVPASQEAAYRAPENEEMMNHMNNINALSSYTDPRQIFNAAYHPNYVLSDLPVDPLLRAWKARVTRKSSH